MDQPKTNANHFMLCHHCTLFKIEKIFSVSSFFESIENEEAKDLSKFFNGIYNDNVKTISLVYNAMQSQNKERISKFLRDFTQKDKNKLENLIALNTDTNKEALDFVKKFVKGSFEEFSEVCRLNSSYNIQGAEMKSMCAAISKTLALSNKEEVSNLELTLSDSDQHGSSDSMPHNLESDDFVDENITLSNGPRDSISQQSQKSTPKNDQNKKVSFQTRKSHQEESELATTPSVDSQTSKPEQKSKRQRRHSMPASKQEPPNKKQKILGEEESNNEKEVKKPRRKTMNNKTANAILESSQTTNEAAARKPDGTEWKLGDWVEARDLNSSLDLWYKSKIVEVKSDQIKIHFHGWNTRFDAWYPAATNDLKPFVVTPPLKERKRTKRKSFYAEEVFSEVPDTPSEKQVTKQMMGEVNEEKVGKHKKETLINSAESEILFKKKLQSQ